VHNGHKLYKLLINSYLQLLTAHIFSTQIKRWEKVDHYNEFSVLPAVTLHHTGLSGCRQPMIGR